MSSPIPKNNNDSLKDQNDLNNSPQPKNGLDSLKKIRKEYNSLFSNFSMQEEDVRLSQHFLYKRCLFKYNKLNSFIKNQDFQGYIYVNITKNNIIYTLTDQNKDVLISLSPRKLRFKKTGRIDFYLTEIVGKCIAQMAIRYDITAINVVFNGPGKSRRAAINAFKQSQLKIVQIIDATPIPHNGCRPRKPKRR